MLKSIEQYIKEGNQFHLWRGGTVKCKANILENTINITSKYAIPPINKAISLGYLVNFDRSTVQYLKFIQYNYINISTPMNYVRAGKLDVLPAVIAHYPRLI